MAQPLVTGYLRNNSLADLEREHGVCAHVNESRDKCSLNYDMLMITPGDKLAEECRGMVIRPPQGAFSGDYMDKPLGDIKLLAWPMSRFYNHGEFYAANIDWSDTELKVYEKLDGTMCTLYWDDLHSKWHVATRSVPEADLPIQRGSLTHEMTFAMLFWCAVDQSIKSRSDDVAPWVDPGEYVDEFLNDLDKRLTYVFELTSPINRVVVKYDEQRVTLIAVRNTSTGDEMSINDVGLEYIPRPRVWSLGDPTSIGAFVNSADPATLEGAVVCDSSFRRLKIKNKSWVLSSKAKDLVTVSKRGAVEAIIAGTIDDVIPLVEKDVAEELAKMQDGIRRYMRTIDEQFTVWKVDAGADRKRFAELVLLSGQWATPFFSLWDNRGRDTIDWIKNMQKSGKLSTSMLDQIIENL